MNNGAVAAVRRSTTTASSIGATVTTAVATTAAIATIVAVAVLVVDGEHLRALSASPFVEGDLGEHEAGALLGEGRQRNGGLDDGSLELEPFADVVKHLQG